MGTLTIAGLSIYPVHFTGDEAEHALHDPWYIKRGVIDAHDNAAGIAMTIVLIAGVVSAYGWWRALKQREEIIPAGSAPPSWWARWAASDRWRTPHSLAARSSMRHRCSDCPKRHRDFRRASPRRRERVDDTHGRASVTKR